MQTSSRFQRLVDDAKSRIQEVTVEEIASQAGNAKPVLIDVREASDWQEGHAEGAIHLSKGVIELKIEN